ncbi:MAG: mycofactocin biosynthesis glycosyltransferase MftF [Acidimicrobiales bacterium]
MGASYVLDTRVRRLRRGGSAEVLLGGEPLRLLRLSAGGARVLDELLSGAPAGATARSSGPSSAASELARRLVAGGVLHPVIQPRPVREGEVAVVVPVRDDAGRLARLLSALRCDFRGPVVVVDDGSRTDSAAQVAEVTSRLGGVLHRRSLSGGPAAARNAAASVLAACEPPPLVAFADADVVPAVGWLDGLVGHFDCPDVGAVAPRVRAGRVPRSVGWVGRSLAAYDSVRSPLDLGAAPASVGAHRRVPYVPAAAIVCRRAALEEVGWFDASMRIGEDVDLVRRLEAAGWAVRYEPRVEVWHDTKGGWREFCRQRFSYGTSAADLERRHPGTVAPFEGTRWGVIGALAAVAGSRRTVSRVWDTCVPNRPESHAGRVGVAAAFVWVAATAVPARALRPKLTRAGVPAPSRSAVAMITRAQLWHAGGLATAFRRVWWPPALVASMLVPRLRRPVLGLLAATELTGGLPAWHRARREPGDAGDRPPLPVVLALGALDDLSYGAGVWVGCYRQRSLRALWPRVAPESGSATGAAVRPSPTGPPTS